MFTFGFSYVGVLYLLMLFIPNIIWAKNQPSGYDAADEKKSLAILERCGEVLCSCCILIFSDFNIHVTKWIIWLIISFILMLLYEIYWIRYFKSKKTLEDFYKPIFGIQVPGATLPVLAFSLLGIYGTNIFMIVSTIILGIGHIGIHKAHYKKLNPPKEKITFRIIKGIVIAVVLIIFSVISFFIAVQNINYMAHHSFIKDGIEDESNMRSFEMTVFNTGKSDCILIVSNGLVILNDAADEDDYEMISETLDQKGITQIDYMIISHFDKDHIGSASSIISNYAVKCVIMPDYTEDSDIYKQMIESISNGEIKTIQTDYDIEADNLRLHVDAPDMDTYDDDNNYSMITHVTFGDLHYLLMGDAKKQRQKEYFDAYPKESNHYDVIKLPHHGDYSKVLDELVQANSSFVAIITDDKSDPKTSDKLIKVLDDNQCRIYFNYDGNIVISSTDGKSMKIKQDH